LSKNRWRDGWGSGVADLWVGPITPASKFPDVGQAPCQTILSKTFFRSVLPSSSERSGVKTDSENSLIRSYPPILPNYLPAYPKIPLRREFRNGNKEIK